jgi:hypothetical protein
MSDIPGSGSFMTTTSAEQFKKLSDFTDHVVTSLNRVEGYHEFLFTNVCASWADSLHQLIDEVIPSR